MKAIWGTGNHLQKRGYHCLPWWKKRPKLCCLLVPQCSILFLTPCNFISSVSQSQKQTMSLLSLSGLQVTPWEGLTCWGVLQATLPIRRVGSMVPILARAYCCPGHFLNTLMSLLPLTSFPSYTFSNVLLGTAPACECSGQTVSKGIFSLLWNTQNSNYLNQPIVSAIPKLVHHLNPDPNSGSVCQLTQKTPRKQLWNSFSMNFIMR